MADGKQMCLEMKSYFEWGNKHYVIEAMQWIQFKAEYTVL